MGPSKINPSLSSFIKQLLANSRGNFLESNDDDIKLVIGIEVKKLRKVLGLTQVEFGGKINLDSAYISKIERGIKPISSVQLFAILSICELDDAIESVIKIINKVRLFEN